MDVNGLLCKKKRKRKKKVKNGGEKEEKYIVKAVRSAVSYTARSTMTAGNAGLDIALCVSLLRRWGGGVGSSPSLIPATRITTAS